MADVRLPAVGAPPVQPPPQKPQARAAQRAFFQAALAAVEPAPVVRPGAVQTPPEPARLAVQPATTPDRKDGYRPGTLLDIKV